MSNDIDEETLRRRLAEHFGTSSSVEHTAPAMATCDHTPVAQDILSIFGNTQALRQWTGSQLEDSKDRLRGLQANTQKASERIIVVEKQRDDLTCDIKKLEDELDIADSNDIVDELEIQQRMLRSTESMLALRTRRTHDAAYKQRTEQLRIETLVKLDDFLVSLEGLRNLQDPEVATNAMRQLLNGADDEREIGHQRLRLPEQPTTWSIPQLPPPQVEQDASSLDTASVRSFSRTSSLDMPSETLANGGAASLSAPLFPPHDDHDIIMENEATSTGEKDGKEEQEISVLGVDPCSSPVTPKLDHARHDDIPEPAIDSAGPPALKIEQAEIPTTPVFKPRATKLPLLMELATSTSVKLPLTPPPSGGRDLYSTKLPMTPPSPSLQAISPATGIPEPQTYAQKDCVRSGPFVQDPTYDQDDNDEPAPQTYAQEDCVRSRVSVHDPSSEQSDDEEDTPQRRAIDAALQQLRSQWQFPEAGSNMNQALVAACGATDVAAVFKQYNVAPRHLLRVAASLRPHPSFYRLCKAVRDPTELHKIVKLVVVILAARLGRAFEQEQEQIIIRNIISSTFRIGMRDMLNDAAFWETHQNLAFAFWTAIKRIGIEVPFVVTSAVPAEARARFVFGTEYQMDNIPLAAWALPLPCEGCDFTLRDRCTDLRYRIRACLAAYCTPSDLPACAACILQHRVGDCGIGEEEEEELRPSSSSLLKRMRDDSDLDPRTELGLRPHPAKRARYDSEVDLANIDPGVLEYSQLPPPSEVDDSEDLSYEDGTASSSQRTAMDVDSIFSQEMRQ